MSKDLNVEGMTRGDFEQMFGDVKESFTAEITKTQEVLRSEMQDGFKELNTKIDRIGARTNEDTSAALKGVAALDKDVAKIKKHLALA